MQEQIITLQHEDGRRATFSNNAFQKMLEEKTRDMPKPTAKRFTEYVCSLSIEPKPEDVFYNQ